MFGGFIFLVVKQFGESTQCYEVTILLVAEVHPRQVDKGVGTELNHQAWLWYLWWEDLIKGHLLAMRQTD